MHTELYLDTARLGRMCSTARRAEQDFARLASQVGSSLYFERFLLRGNQALPGRLRDRLPHLHTWAGLTGLKRRLCRFLRLPTATPVHLASRSAELMTLAGHCLFRHCQDVMVTDIEWPPYLALLDRIAKRRRRSLQVVPLRRLLLTQRLPNPSVAAEYLADSYRENHCDGIFLSDVAYFGVRLPVNEVLKQLPSARFVVVDGAQAMNHVPVCADGPQPDIYLAGTQKWLGAYLPLSIAFCCAQRTLPLIGETAAQCRRDGLLDDPLFEFCTDAQQDSLPTVAETVNLTPLITAAAALSHAMDETRPFERCWDVRRANAELFADLLPPSWRLFRVCQSMRTAVLLLQSGSRSTRLAPPDQLRFQFHRRGVCLSTYVGGVVRVSMPEVPFSRPAIATIQTAFSQL